MDTLAFPTELKLGTAAVTIHALESVKTDGVLRGAQNGLSEGVARSGAMDLGGVHLQKHLRPTFGLYVRDQLQ